jgi:hypothetical protein
MSNPLYEQVKAKVEASSFAADQSADFPLNWHDYVRKAEHLRSASVARVIGNLFSRMVSVFSGAGGPGGPGGMVERARTANALSALDEADLAKLGLKQTDLPGYVAGQATQPRKPADQSPTKAA